MVAIIDYGAGNLRSVSNALKTLGVESIITRDAEEIKNASHVILPGVGSFGWAMQMIDDLNLRDTIREAALSGKPFLGICLGLQLLFDESEESPGYKGLGVFEGKIVRFEDRGLKIPHMGWNSLEFPKKARMFEHLDLDPYVYFVHSYYAQPKDESIVSANVTYGQTVCVAVEKDNIFAAQFHPEKSGQVGMQILKNFISREVNS